MERILNHYHSFLVLGISTLVLGVLAVLSPFQAGLRFEIMVAFIFIGVGLTRGTRTVSRGKVGTIVAGWVLTPMCAAVFAMLLYKLLRVLLA